MLSKKKYIFQVNYTSVLILLVESTALKILSETLYM